MNRGPFIFIGVFAIISLSWALTLIKPIEEAGHLEAIGIGNDRIPRALTGAANQGREVYQELGCVSCHTQQVRLRGMDIERGWGDRQTMAIDYIDQSPVYTGFSRVGPDLSNVGLRLIDPDWHLLHFYNPRITSEGSNMPSYSFLFEKREIVGQRSDRALELEGAFDPGDGYEVVPTRRAEALVAYMLSLKFDYELDEAPTPEKVAYK